jgi:hypothetical protein
MADAYLEERDVIARSGLSAAARRVKAEATKQSIFSFFARRQWIASLALAMTASARIGSH